MERKSGPGDFATLPDGWRIEDERPAADGEPLKLAPVSSGAEGYREIVSLEDGFQLVKSDIEFVRDTAFPVSIDSVLKFQFRLQGEGSLKIDGGEDIQLREYSGGVLLQPAGLEKLECYRAGVHERAVTLLVSPEYLRSKLPALVNEAPSPLTFYLDAKIDEVFSAVLPMTPEIIAAAQALYQPAVKPNFATVYRQSRAQELLIYCLELLTTSSPENAINLKSRDIDHITEARAIIERNIESPPPIRDLARSVGINESKLMAGFKQLYNQTIHEYIQTLRMNRAKELLATTDLSITQIAFEVGYEFSSNFTTAFKRHFGVTPSNIRKPTVISGA